MKKLVSTLFVALLCLSSAILHADDLLGRIPASSQFVAILNSNKIIDCPIVAPLLAETKKMLQAQGLSIDDGRSITALGIELKDSEKVAFTARMVSKYNNSAALKFWSSMPDELRKRPDFKEISKRAITFKPDTNITAGVTLLNKDMMQLIVSTEATDLTSPLKSGNTNVMFNAKKAFNITGEPAIVLACDVKVFENSKKSDQQLPVKNVQFAALVLDTVGTEGVSLTIYALSSTPEAAAQLTAMVDAMAKNLLAAPNVPPALNKIQFGTNGKISYGKLICTYAEIMAIIASATPPAITR